MFVTLSVYTECDQRIEISNDPDNPDGIMMEVFEMDGKQHSERLHLSPKEVIQLAKALQSVEDLRKA